MNKLTTFLVVSMAALAVLASVGPTLVALSHALVPLIIAAGLVAAVLRLVYYHTRKW